MARLPQCQATAMRSLTMARAPTTVELPRDFIRICFSLFKGHSENYAFLHGAVAGVAVIRDVVVERNRDDAGEWLVRGEIFLHVPAFCDDLVHSLPCASGVYQPCIGCHRKALSIK